MKKSFLIVIGLFLTACSDLASVGRAPGLTPINQGAEHDAMVAQPLPVSLGNGGPTGESSLWSADQASLLGDRRAEKRGDILTVVIEIDDKAEFSNASDRSRQGSESAAVGSLFGRNHEGLQPIIEAESSGSFSGNGSVNRKEKLTLRIAATVVNVLPNGVLEIMGTQEVRVNYELRELIVQGYVRPQDISRQNEVTYDKMASARISYGGRGQITEVQEPRYGQQIIEKLSPF
jgi:flagellar L-ring protein precursor FlgH